MIESRIRALVKLGEKFGQFQLENSLEIDFSDSQMKRISTLAHVKNNWFTIENQLFAAKQWAEQLKYENLTEWISNYTISYKEKTVGIICAGNIPWVGLHDVLCAFLSGCNVKVKLSSKDEVLMNFAIGILNSDVDGQDSCIQIVDKIKEIDFLIATGSDNTARYIDFYFKDKPRIIRRNRTSVAILTNETTDGELKKLSTDIFQYFGLGCRSVSHLFLPIGFDLDRLKNAFDGYEPISIHNKYMNNYDYQKAIKLMNQEEIIDLKFCLLVENNSLASPISVVHYSFYEDLENLNKNLLNQENELQCIVEVDPKKHQNSCYFGQSQQPKISDYADNIDTIEFLMKA